MWVYGERIVRIVGEYSLIVMSIPVMYGEDSEDSG
jgi:hypothetical protein